MPILVRICLHNKNSLQLCEGKAFLPPTRALPLDPALEHSHLTQAPAPRLTIKVELMQTMLLQAAIWPAVQCIQHDLFLFRLTVFIPRNETSQVQRQQRCAAFKILSLHQFADFDQGSVSTSTTKKKYWICCQSASAVYSRLRKIPSSQ